MHRVLRRVDRHDDGEVAGIGTRGGQLIEDGVAVHLRHRQREQDHIGVDRCGHIGTRSAVGRGCDAAQTGPFDRARSSKACSTARDQWPKSVRTRSFAWISMSDVWPWSPDVHGWWRRKRALGSAWRRITVRSGNEVGWSADAIEAQAFAYLAVRTLKGLPLTFPTTTGVPRAITGGMVARPE